MAVSRWTLVQLLITEKADMRAASAVETTPKGSIAADSGHPLFRTHGRKAMDRGLLLFLIGAVLPIIVLLFLLWQHVF
jgi:hypothetical protein